MSPKSISSNLTFVQVLGIVNNARQKLRPKVFVKKSSSFLFMRMVNHRLVIIEGGMKGCRMHIAPLTILRTQKPEQLVT